MSNPIPQGKYKPAVRKGNLIFTAGMTPRLNGQLIMSGKVESGVSVEDYRQAADQATANALNAALSCVQPGEKITQILSLTVYINAAPDFTSHAKIGDLVSDYLYEKLGDAGIGAWAAIGMGTLPVMPLWRSSSSPGRSNPLPEQQKTGGSQKRASVFWDLSLASRGAGTVLSRDWSHRRGRRSPRHPPRPHRWPQSPAEPLPAGP